MRMLVFDKTTFQVLTAMLMDIHVLRDVRTYRLVCR